MNSLGKDHALRMGGSGSVELLCEFGLLPQQHRKRVLIFLPVLDILTGYTAFDGGLGHSGTHLSNQSWIDGLWNEVVATEGEVVHLIDVVHHIGHRLLGQVSDSVNGCQFHLLVDSGSVYVEGTTEDVGESDDVVDLVRIVGTTC